MMNTGAYGIYLLILLILGLFWQRNPHQSEGMAYASQLLFPHGSDLCCVCRRHQSNQIPHHLSSSKCIPFSFTPLSKLFWKCVMKVHSGAPCGRAVAQLHVCSVLSCTYAPVWWIRPSHHESTRSLPPYCLCPLLLLGVFCGCQIF